MNLKMFTEEDMLGGYKRGYSEGTEDGVRVVLSLLIKRMQVVELDRTTPTDLKTSHILFDLYRDLIDDIQKNITG